MNQTSWQKIEEIFNAALELPTEKRSPFLETTCAGDDYLRREVESLLANAETEDSFLGKHNLSLGLAVLSEKSQHAISGEKIGRYQINKLLGEGGMGEVYLAKDLPLNRLVALKLLPSYLIEDDQSVVRFQKEARAASAISHPNIAHIYEAGIEENRRFIAMEFVEGTTLRDLLKQKKLNFVKALDIVLQTANALVSAHSAGIIHRDIKPENIMVRPDGYVKVLDFGIAKLLEGDRDGSSPPRASASTSHTAAGLIMGTIGYISPEQLKGEDVDLRSDIWSLGVVLYESLTGRKPFPGKDSDEVGHSILRDPVPTLSTTGLDLNNEAALNQILAKTLNKRAAGRYQSTTELAEDLKTIKQNLEFSQQFSGETTGERSSDNISGTFGETGNSSFITKSRQFWNQQSFSRKALLLAVTIGFLTFGLGFSVQYLSRFWGTSRHETFTPESTNRWQFSTLYGVRKRDQGLIPSIAFSPDSKSIVFSMYAEGTDSIYVKELNQTVARKISNGVGMFQTPVFSPNGTEIAFVSNSGNRNAIWTIPAEGGTPTLKTSLSINTALCSLLKWSNDGTQIFFQSGQLLKKIDLASGEITEVKFPAEELGGSFSISPDESTIGFNNMVGDKQKLSVFNLLTGEILDATDLSPFWLSPAVMPGNSRMIFSSDQNGSSQLYVTDFKSKKSTQLTLGDSNAISPIVSPDGRSVVYVTETNSANIYSLSLNNREEERLTDATKMQLFPDLSRDGKTLVFQSIDDMSGLTKSPLKLRNLETKTESALENQQGYWAKWSPVSDDIAYLRQDGLDAAIWKTNSSSSEPIKLTTNGVWTEGYSPAPMNLMSFPFDWSNQGTKIAYVSNESKISNVCIVDRDGTNFRQLTNNTERKRKYSSPLWSPDGNKIAFCSRIENEPNKYQFGLSVIAGTDEKELFHSEKRIRLLTWDINAQSLFLSVEGSNQIEIYKVTESAAPEKLIEIKNADIESFAPSPDAKTIAYSAKRNGFGNIFSYSINGRETQLTDNKDETILFSTISWSPAGDRLFYSKQSGGMQINMISDNPEKTE